MKTINGLSRKHIFLLLGLSFLLFLGVYFFYMLNVNTIHKGVAVGTIDISGLTKQQAVSKVNNGMTNFNTTYLTLKHADKLWNIPYSQIDAKFNVEQAIDKAYLIGRTGNIFNRIREIMGARVGKKFDVVFDYNKDLLYNKIADISKEIDKPKTNAKIIPISGKGAIVPSVIGTKLDIQQAFLLANEHISKLDNAIIELPIMQDLPTVNETDLKNMTTEISTYSTKFDSNYVQRAQNIKLACSRINGTILKPNETFSIDKKILNRTTDNGYQVAKAYRENEVVDEVGGGVCQVTTTLYDAVLTANLAVVERKQHSMVVDYVEPGLDAAVSDSGVDFKFKNSFGFPIYLYSNVEGNSVIMKVYGEKTETGQRIQLESEVSEIYYPQPEAIIIDYSMPDGKRKVEQKSKNGYKAKLYKAIYKDGILISRELVSENLYKPLRGKIKIGD